MDELYHLHKPCGFTILDKKQHKLKKVLLMKQFEVRQCPKCKGIGIGMLLENE